MKTLIIMLLIGTTFQLAAQEDPKYLNVLASNGLNMRSRPEETARIMTRIPYGSMVEVLELTDAKLQLGWITDKWYLVRFRGREGYVFGGYLSTLKAPVQNGSGQLPELLVDYCKSSFHESIPTVETMELFSAKDTLVHRLSRFDGGHALEQEIRGERLSAKLLIRTSMQDAFVLLEALLKQNEMDHILDELRFVKNREGQLSRISTASGSVKLQQLSQEVVMLQLPAHR